MEILVIGSEPDLLECRQKFGGNHKYQVHSNPSDAKLNFHDRLIVFDFLIGSQPQQIRIYREFYGTVFLDASKLFLTELISASGITASAFGFCGMPTFVNRKILEVTQPVETNQQALEKICTPLNTPFALVKDQVGMVTPRVIGMIINEAYSAVQEGIASRADIDLAMKLGTNYPYGPFEWAARIGVKNVWALLKAVYLHTKDERYRVCSLLEEEAKNDVQP